MTVSNSSSKQAPQSMDGVATQFFFTFEALTDISQASGIKATVLDTLTSIETPLIFNDAGADGYTVAVDADGVGGSITVISSRTATDTITIFREYEELQGTNYADFNAFPSETVEDNQDKLTFIAQQQSERVNRAIVLPITLLGVSTTLPAPISNQIIGWNTAATALENKVDPSLAAAASAAAAAASASAASTSASGASASASSATTSASNASTSSTNASTSETNSAASAAASAASALTIPDPSTGAVADQIRVNATQTAYEIFTPSVGGATLTQAVNQTTHGFSVNDWVYHNGTIYALADASATATAESIGVVSAVADVNNFTVQFGGHITGLVGLTVGGAHFLSETAGAITATAPSTVGAVVKPVLVADSTTTGFIFNMLGIEVATSVSTAAFRQSFTNATLTAGVLTATHSLGSQYVSVTVYDNNNNIIIPDDVTATSTTVSTIDLLSFGIISGTWNIVIIG